MKLTQIWTTVIGNLQKSVENVKFLKFLENWILSADAVYKI
jgi:hypothetical protein